MKMKCTNKNLCTQNGRKCDHDRLQRLRPYKGVGPIVGLDDGSPTPLNDRRICRLSF